MNYQHWQKFGTGEIGIYENGEVEIGDIGFESVDEAITQFREVASWLELRREKSRNAGINDE